MCHPSHIAYWPPLWWLHWWVGAATALAAKSSVLIGSISSSSARSPLLKLHVSQLKLRPAAPLPSQQRPYVYKRVHGR